MPSRVRGLARALFATDKVADLEGCPAQQNIVGIDQGGDDRIAADLPVFVGGDVGVALVVGVPVAAAVIGAVAQAPRLVQQDGSDVFFIHLDVDDLSGLDLHGCTPGGCCQSLLYSCVLPVR